VSYKPFYRKRLERKREKTRRQCAVMRSAKERKRRERACAWRDVGGFVGVLGEHRVRLLARDDYPALAVTVDGECRQARTLRGVVRCMSAMIFQAQNKSEETHAK